MDSQSLGCTVAEGPETILRQVGHRSGTNPKTGQVLTKDGSVVPKLEFYIISPEPVCEVSATSKLCVGFSSLNHPYIP
jgi:hypothetical protein